MLAPLPVTYSASFVLIISPTAAALPSSTSFCVAVLVCFAPSVMAIWICLMGISSTPIFSMTCCLTPRLMNVWPSLVVSCFVRCAIAEVISGPADPGPAVSLDFKNCSIFSACILAFANAPSVAASANCLPIPVSIPVCGSNSGARPPNACIESNKPSDALPLAAAREPASAAVVGGAFPASSASISTDFSMVLISGSRLFGSRYASMPPPIFDMAAASISTFFCIIATARFSPSTPSSCIFSCRNAVIFLSCAAARSAALAEFFNSLWNFLRSEEDILLSAVVSWEEAPY